MKVKPSLANLLHFHYLSPLTVSQNHKPVKLVHFGPIIISQLPSCNNKKYQKYYQSLKKRLFLLLAKLQFYFHSIILFHPLQRILKRTKLFEWRINIFFKLLSTTPIPNLTLLLIDTVAASSICIFKLTIRIAFEKES